MRPVIAGIALLVSTALAGCIGSDPTEPVADVVGGVPAWATLALPFEEHDHHDPADHAGLSTPNFELLGWDPLVSEHHGATAGGHLCGDSVDAGERRFGAVHGIGTDVAFELVDLMDPAAPTVVGELILPNGRARDVAVTPDARFVVVASTGPPRPSVPIVAAPALPAARGGLCGDAVSGSTVDETPYPPGVLLANVEDPDNIFVESVLPLPGAGTHSIYAGDLAGETVIIASVTNVATAAVHFYFIGIDDGPDGNQLMVRGLYQDDPTAGGAPLLNGHNDGVVQVHPVTGEKLAYLANWHQGMVIVNIDDLSQPRFVGRYSDTPGTHAELSPDGPGSVHEAIPIAETWNGRHYTFIGQEILGKPSERSSGWVRVIDTTDPSSPFPVAEWSLPVDVVWDAGLIFSTHYVSYHERTLYVAHYHAGVWAVDLSNLETDPMLPAVGVFVPANVSPKPPAHGGDVSYSWTPTVMDANILPNGDLVVWDMTSGVYVVSFDATNPMAPALPFGFPGFE